MPDTCTMEFLETDNYYLLFDANDVFVLLWDESDKEYRIREYRFFQFAPVDEYKR